MRKFSELINENMKKANLAFPLTYYIIASGGYLKEPLIEKIIITEDVFNEATEEGDTQDETLEYLLADATGEYEQKFVQTIVLSEINFNKIKNIIATEAYKII